VWLGRGEQGSVTASAAIAETPPYDPKRPFYIFAEMRATDWKTSCKEVTATSAIAGMLGASRDLHYDPPSGCVLLDGWAPIKMKYETACRLAAMQQAMRVSLLSVTREKNWDRDGLPLVQSFCKLMDDLCDPELSDDIAAMC